MFIGRNLELNQLKSFFLQNRAAIAVIYGRRRVGKSSLIREAARGHHFFSFEGVEGQSRSKQIRIFTHQLREYGVSGIPSDVKEWFELLPYLAELVHPNEPTVIVLDEFQWLGNYRQDIVSELKLVWDQKLSNLPNLKLILCGSVASFMVKKVVRSRALFGRCALSIDLQPFSLCETRALLADKSEEEVLLAHQCVGGIPYYLSLLTDRSSVLLSLAFHCSTAASTFVTEFQKIFVSHFGKNALYESLIRALKSRRYGASRAELIQDLHVSNSGYLTAALEDLEYAGMISSFVPYDKKRNSHTKRYVLVDRYLDFYLTFIEPLIQSGELGRINFISQVFETARMVSWLGKSFELTCLREASKIAGILGFGGIRFEAGPFFQHGKKGDLVGVQFDLVFGRADKVVTVCEVKCLDVPVPLSVGKHFAKQVDSVFDRSKVTVQRVLISKTAPSKELENSHLFSSVITLGDLLETAK